MRLETKCKNDDKFSCAVVRLEFYFGKKKKFKHIMFENFEAIDRTKTECFTFTNFLHFYWIWKLHKSYDQLVLKLDKIEVLFPTCEGTSEVLASMLFLSF